MPGYEPYQTNSLQLRPGEYQRNNPWETLPYGGIINSALDMFGGTQALGLPPMGNDRHTNINRSLRAQMYQQSHDSMMQTAAKADFENIDTMARGLRGKKPYSAEDQATVQAGWTALSQFAGNLDNPAALRMMSDLQGGRSAVPLAHYLHSAGRFMRDPKTGAVGLSGNSAAEMGIRLRDDLYGTPGDKSQTAGLGSADVGEMIQELTYSGRMLKSSPGGRNAMRPGAAEDIKATIKDYSRILSTMKDIFVENGKPSASVRELLDAADAITGGVQGMSAKEAEGKLRSFQATAQQHGISMEAMIGATQLTQGVMQEAGVSIGHRRNLTDAGMDYRSGFMTESLNQGGAWGRENVDQSQQRMLRQTSRFVNSQAANRLGALSRILESEYGDDPDKIKGDSDTAKAMRAMARGDFKDPHLQQMLKQNETAFVKDVAQQTGRRTDQVISDIEMQTENEAQLDRKNLAAKAAQATQFESVRAETRRGADEKTTAEVRASLGQDKLTRGGAAVSTALTDVSLTTVEKMDAATRGDETKRNAAMGKAMRDKLEAMVEAGGEGSAEAKAMLDQYRGEEGDKKLSLLAGYQYGAAQNRWRDRYAGGNRHEVLDNAYGTLNEDAQDATAQARGRRKVDEFINTQLTGSVDHSVMGRLGSYMQSTGPGGVKVDALIKAGLGMDPTDKQKETLVKSFDAMTAARKQIEETVNKHGQNADAQEVKEALKELEKRRKEFTTFIDAPEQAELKKALVKQAAKDAGVEVPEPEGEGESDGSGSSKEKSFKGTLKANTINISGGDWKIVGTFPDANATATSRRNA